MMLKKGDRICVDFIEKNARYCVNDLWVLSSPSIISSVVERERGIEIVSQIDRVALIGLYMLRIASPNFWECTLRICDTGPIKLIVIENEDPLLIVKREL